MGSKFCPRVSYQDYSRQCCGQKFGRPFRHSHGSLKMARRLFFGDNQEVHTNLESFRKGFNPCNNACSDDDLWTQAHELCTLAVERNLLIKVVKVKAKAHEDSMKYSDPIEQWALRGNHAADGAAKAARTLFPLQCWHV